MFEPSAMAILTSKLLYEKEERENTKKLLMHFEEIIANDGIGQFFDETDAIYLCQLLYASLDALEISVNKNGK